MLSILRRESRAKTIARPTALVEQPAGAAGFDLVEAPEPAVARSEVLARLIEQNEPKTAAGPLAANRTMRERLAELYAHD